MKNLLLFCFLSFSILTNAQTQAKDSVYMIVDQMPQFKGGNGALMQFLSDTFSYTDSIQPTGNPRVLIRFVINKTGKVEQIETISKDNDSRLVEAATDVIRKMPDWIPGQLNGEPVSVYFTVPFRINLER